jgi:CBS domain-containing protein
MTLWSTEISNLKLDEPITVDAKEKVAICIKKMQDNKATCIPVVNGNKKLIGVFTEREFMNTYVETNLPGDTEVSAVMRRPAPSIKTSSSIQEALDILGKEKIRVITTIDEENQVCGTLTAGNLLDYIVEFFPDDLLNLAPDSHLKTSINMDGG